MGRTRWSRWPCTLLTLSDYAVILIRYFLLIMIIVIDAFVIAARNRTAACFIINTF